MNITYFSDLVSNITDTKVEKEQIFHEFPRVVLRYVNKYLLQLRMLSAIFKRSLFGNTAQDQTILNGG